MQRLPAVLHGEGAREGEREGGGHATGKRGWVLGTAAVVTEEGRARATERLSEEENEKECGERGWRGGERAKEREGGREREGERWNGMAWREREWHGRAI